MAFAADAEVKPKLRVCADPNNLPYSNEKQEGFENKLAEIIAHDLGRELDYTWWASRRGFFRATLNSQQCDVVMGVPVASERALTTDPYYRSTYVFVTRKDRKLDIRSINDPRLLKLKVGVQIIGDDYNNSPPAESLAKRGAIKNVVGYTVYGNYLARNPTARIVEAVAKGDVDVAIVWGPQAGYFASQQDVPLAITPIKPLADGKVPFTFEISLGVRRKDEKFREQLDSLIKRHRDDISKLLAQYHIPVLRTPDPQRERREEK
jgi:quinoprotein dehydrogenase-associated probable ABC transporter substrate-binding protein